LGTFLMTDDQSVRVTDLLADWHDYSYRYKPYLGVRAICMFAPRSGEKDGDEVDDQILKLRAETVEACVDELNFDERQVVGMFAAINAGRKPVGRGWEIEEFYTMFNKTKPKLLDKFKKRGLMN
jgi:hypothetical protein